MVLFFKVASYLPSALHAAPIAAAVLRYSPATEVSHVYSSLAAPAALAYAPSQIAYSSPAIGSTQQNIIRSFDGTVSQHSKAVDTAFSSVRKVDTRVNNKVYSPALALAAPASALSYAAPSLYASASPALPLAAKTISYGAALAAPIAHVSFDGYGVHYAY